MPSPFAKYQSEQVQQIAPGFVEAFGNAGRSIGQGLAAAGQAAVQGYEEAEKKRKEEIATKAKLAPYIRNDDRITATEGMIKAGLLTKADNGTVVISANYANYADKKGLEKYISFYNETGGDGSKLKGDALIEFANRFEGEQKYIAEKAANAKAKIETELKQAQILKLRAEAAAKGGETALFNSVLGDLTGGSIGGTPIVSDSPTAGIDLTRFLNGTSITSTGTLPSRTPTTVTTVSNTVPGVAAAPAAAPAATLSPALTAGTSANPAPAAAATGAAPAVSSALTAGTTGTPVATEEPEVTTWAEAAKIVGESEKTARNRGEGIAGLSPAEYVSNWRLNQAAAAPAPAENAPAAEAAPAASKTTTPTPAAAPEPAAPAAGAATGTTPAASETTAAAPASAPEGQPQVYDVPAESARVTAKLADINSERETVRAKYTAIRTKNAATRERQRLAAIALGTKGAGILTFLDNSKKFEDEAEARELKALDDKKELIDRNFANYQAAATSQRTAKKDVAAEKKAESDARKAEADAKAASTKAAQVLSDRKKQRLLEYPSYGVWTHLGARMGKDKNGNEIDPSDFDIKPLSPTAAIEVNAAAEGWNKTTDFLINLDTTLKNRVKDGDEWRNRFALTAGNMKNYFEGELASVFGVATLRRAIVSGGNFSDADREFVKSAITYINTAAPYMKAEDLKASLDALAVFVNGMYERTLETNDMGYDPVAAKAQAEKLEAAGFPDRAAKIRKGVDRAGLFYSRFGIKPPGGNAPAVSQENLQAAFDVLYPKMKAKGLLPAGLKIN